MATFEEHQPGHHPTFLRGVWGRAWGAVSGAEKDRVLEGVKDAVRAGFVLIAPDDALPRLLADAGLEALPGELVASQRSRVSEAFTTWEFAGTLPGLQVALAFLGIEGTFIRWPEYAPDPPPDGRADRWATWLLVVTSHPYASDGTWGDAGDWDDGGTWDSDATVEDVARIRRLLRAQMFARDRGFLRLVFDLTADFWGPETPWDEGIWADATLHTHTTIEV